MSDVSDIQEYRNALAEARDKIQQWKNIALTALEDIPGAILTYDRFDDPRVWEIEDLGTQTIALREWYGRGGTYDRGVHSAIWFSRDDDQRPCCDVPAEVLREIRRRYMGKEGGNG